MTTIGNRPTLASRYWDIAKLCWGPKRKETDMTKELANGAGMTALSARSESRLDVIYALIVAHRLTGLRTPRRLIIEAEQIERQRWAP